ncbi:MAG: VWA domain-containing protein [Deltaproteobacteria bacterium]|nr:VWA domain-containing protein [Deltaproteobacteria bacterium]
MGNKGFHVTGLAALAAVVFITQVAPAVAEDKVKLKIATGSGVVQAGRTERAFLKVSLTGFALPEGGARAPVNVAIVLDRSGSMSGEKIAKAKEAALLAVDRLGGDDTVALVAYNHTVSVLVPSTKVSDRTGIRKAISELFADGNTALFAGVSKGAEEVRKFIDRNRVNRVVLLSDGLANVGPSSPGDLGYLGSSLFKEGISVTTIGLGGGYNEDLMAELARRSDGNHAFAENAVDLARIFTYEFGDVLSVVAREVVVEVRCAPGVRPIRVLGRDAEVSGQNVYARMNQLYGSQEKYLLVEVELPPGADGATRELATVHASYANTVTRTTDVLGGSVSVRYSASPDAVAKSAVDDVMVSAVELVANEANKNAVLLRDRGNVVEARRVLDNNASFLSDNAARYKSKKLDRAATMNRGHAEALNPAAGKDWNVQRKAMRDAEFEADMQQAW